MKIWHYTVGVHLRSIVRDGQINPSTAWVGEGERPAVWCTINPQWEATANKAMRMDDGQLRALSKRETASEGEGLYRIEVMPEACPYGWNDWKRLSRINERLARSLARVGREVGSNYDDWRASFEPITAKSWVRIEIENRDQWDEIAIEVAKEWTRPIIEKGCPVCREVDRQAGDPWRYMPDPKTGEPQVVCSPCYARILVAIKYTR